MLYTRKEIAVMYGITSARQISKWLKKMGLVDEKITGKGKRCTLTPLELEIFMAKVGPPPAKR